MKLPKLTWKKVLLGLGILAVGGIVYGSTRKPVTTYETVAVDRGTVVEEVSVTGSLTPTSRIALEPEASGRVTKINVADGADVTAGTVLVELDARDIAARVSSQSAAVESARARLAELVAGATPEELLRAQAAVSTAESRRDAAVAAKGDAEVALTNAKSNLENVVAKGETLLVSGTATLLLDYQSAVTKAHEAIDRLTKPLYTYDGQLTFSTNDFDSEVQARNSRSGAVAAASSLDVAASSAVSAGSTSAAIGAYSAVSANLTVIRNHLELTRVAVTNAVDLSSKDAALADVGAAIVSIDGAMQTANRNKSDLELQQRLNASEKLTAQINVNNAESALTSATFAVDSAEKAVAQANADLALTASGNRAEVIAGQRAVVRSQEATLASLSAELSKRRITAPIDGIVTDVAVELGESVTPGKAAVTMQAKGAFEIVTNVSEIDIGKVSVGDPVEITLDAFPRTEKWTGKVVTVQPAEKVVEGVIFYETKVVFDNEDPRLRSGMTANLTVETDRRENALRVPLRGVKDRRDQSFVEVLVNGAPEEREIVMGIQNTDHGEVLSGVAEGDQIVVSSTTK